MKKITHLAVVSFVLFFTTASGFSSGLRNGDFEKGLSAWLLQKDGGSSLTGTEADAHARFEDDGIIIDVQSLESKQDKAGSVILMQYIGALEEGVNYTLSFDVRVPNDETMSYAIGLPITSGPNRANLGGGVPLVEINGKGSWQSVSRSFTWDPTKVLEEDANVDPATVSLQFRIGLTNEFGIRNVKLER